MNKTAVEFLENQIIGRITRRNPHDTIIIQTQEEILINIIKQAKEMELEQMTEAWKEGYDLAINGGRIPKL